MKIASYFAISALVTLTFNLHAQDLVLYTIEFREKNKKENVGFTSLSETYSLSGHPDSLVIIPYQKEKDSSQYFILESMYRARLLSQAKISESDKVFIFDCATAAVVSIPVKSLDIAARLSVYVDTNEWPYAQNDFQIGFEIRRKFLKTIANLNNALVYVGKDNPFVQGKLRPLLWRKIDSKYFPSKKINQKDSTRLHRYGNYETSDTHKFELEGLQYFIQDLSIKGRIFARRLLVIGEKTEIVRERIYYDTESTTLEPLTLAKTHNGIGNNQWTGRLFKNKPSVIFGFLSHSFGCPSITFLNQSETDIYISCDNRH